MLAGIYAVIMLLTGWGNIQKGRFFKRNLIPNLEQYVSVMRPEKPDKKDDSSLKEQLCLVAPQNKQVTAWSTALCSDFPDTSPLTVQTHLICQRSCVTLEPATHLGKCMGRHACFVRDLVSLMSGSVRSYAESSFAFMRALSEAGFKRLH